MADASFNELPSGSPARWAGRAAIIVGAATLAFGTWLAIGTAQPLPLAVGLAVCGLIEIATGVFALRVVRIAWSFACSLNGTLFLVFLFGSPTLRDRADIPIALALIPALVFGVVTLLYALGSEDY